MVVRQRRADQGQGRAWFLMDWAGQAFDCFDYNSAMIYL